LQIYLIKTWASRLLFLDEFFRVCSRCLKPDGQMLLQAITIRDQVFDWHKRNVDFIKRYL
jgi:cyclopropane-fatty-acyl-phospholipid synthase